MPESWKKLENNYSVKFKIQYNKLKSKSESQKVNFSIVTVQFLIECSSMSVTHSRKANPKENEYPIPWSESEWTVTTIIVEHFNVYKLNKTISSATKNCHCF